ncbi:MAG: DegT/DnrJ/EryC1/StrS family aminotransferase [Gammaproteobacteria bacterium]
MKIPIVDLNAQHQQIQNELEKAIDCVIKKGDFISGDLINKFEENFARFCNVKYAVGCSSGTSALHLALLSCGIKAGDEVITTPHTFIATAEAISQVGAKPIFVDINAQTFNIDPNKIEQAITKKTKAIIPVHLYGQCADMQPIIKIAKKYKLKIIEDAAQAHGASYNHQNAGSFGDTACFSFYPGKNLGAFGDAGIVVTNNKALAEKMRVLANHGRKAKYEHSILGYNYRLDTIQAAILNIKLKHLSKWNKARKRIAEVYNKKLASILELSLPTVQNNNEHVYHLYVIKTKQRNKLQKYLSQKGIATGIHYPIPLHLQKAYSFLGHKKGDFPEAEKIAKQILSLPMHPYLNQQQQSFIVKNINHFFKD